MIHEASYTFPLNVVQSTGPNSTSRRSPTVLDERASKTEGIDRGLAASSAMSGAAESTFGGDLETVPVMQLLRVMATRRASGVLTLLSSRGTGKLNFRDGKVVAARLGRIAGDKALRLIKRLESGLFLMRLAGALPGSRSSSRRDRSRRRVPRAEPVHLRTAPTVANTPLMVHDEPSSDSNVVLLPSARKILAKFRSGRTIAESLAAGEVGQHEVPMLVSLLDMGVLRPAAAG